MDYSSGKDAEREDRGIVKDRFTDVVTRTSGSLSPALARVAHYLDRNRPAVLASSAAQIAERLGISDATVIRAVQALGFDGLPDLKRVLAETLVPDPTPATNMRTTLASAGASVADAIAAVLDAHVEAVMALATESGRSDIAAAVTALHPAKRIGIFGIGPSAHLARYVALELGRVGRRSVLFDATGWALADQLLDLEQDDAVIVLAYGHPYREVRGVMGEARRKAATVVLVTDNGAGALAREATVVVLARRGRTNEVALHAATLAALEAIVLGLAAVDPEQSMAQLTELVRLRKLIGP